MNDVDKSLNILLNNFWITKDNDRDTYYYLKKNNKKIQEFVNKNLGSKLIVNDRFIKLEKIPSSAHTYYGIEEFTSVFDYVLLFLMLIFLEDKPKDEKFILSELIEEIKRSAITLNLNQIPDWNLRAHRISLSKVLHLLEKLNIIVLLDKDDSLFEDYSLSEALYSSTGLANYLLPTYDYDIEKSFQKEDFINNDFYGRIESADIKRFKVFRNLLYNPAFSFYDLSSNEVDYLKKMHKNIEDEINNNLGWTVEITKNMALCYTNIESINPNYFPNNKRYCEIILLINEQLLNYKKNKHISLDNNEIFRIPTHSFKNILDDLRINKKEYFSKEILSLPNNKYIEMFTNLLEKYAFIKKEDDDILVFPTITRFVGYTKEVKIDDKQLIMEGMFNEKS